MKKIFLFNYFLQKCANFKEALLGVGSKEAMLSLVFSHSWLIHRHKYGVCQDEIYLTNRRYVEELFLIFCLEAKKQDKDLLQEFSFHHKQENQYGFIFDYFVDDDIDCYLNKLYLPVNSKQQVDFLLYENLTKLSAEELLSKSYHLGNLCKLSGAELELPKSDASTNMVDEVWEQLENDGVFFTLLKSSNMFNTFRKSIGVETLMKEYHKELERYIY